MTPAAPDAETLAVWSGRRDVSRETLTRLGVFIAELSRWQTRFNLVGPRTLSDVWRRHVADSLQLLPHAAGRRRWLDLGSGAGFPGLVIAAALADAPPYALHLVESDISKAAFLREAARKMGVSAVVHARRIDDVLPSLMGEIDVVTARAVAELSRLIDWSLPLLTTGGVGIFPKGQNVASEMQQLGDRPVDVSLAPSLTEPDARIVVVRHAKASTAA